MTLFSDSFLDSVYDSFLLINSRPDCILNPSESSELYTVLTVRYSHLSVCRLYHLLSLLPSDAVVTRVHSQRLPPGLSPPTRDVGQISNGFRWACGLRISRKCVGEAPIVGDLPGYQQVNPIIPPPLLMLLPWDLTRPHACPQCSF